MKKLLAVLILSLGLGSAFGKAIYAAKNDYGDVLVLMDTECVLPQLQNGKGEGTHAAEFQRANGEKLQACWKFNPKDGQVYVIYEDNDVEVVPIKEFKALKGV